MGKIPGNSDIIVDANLPRRYVDALMQRGIKPLYIPDINPGMSDTNVKYLGDKYGGIPIATRNVKHFKDYRPLIELGSKNNVKDTLEYLGYA